MAIDLVYLASPYSHTDRLVVKNRFKITEFMTYHYMRQKQGVFSPIVHCHEIAWHYGLPSDALYWEEYNDAFIARCQEVRVLELPDWHQSKGIQMEIKKAEEAEIRITHVSWEDIILALLQRVGQHNELYQRAMFLEHVAPIR